MRVQGINGLVDLLEDRLLIKRQEGVQPSLRKNMKEDREIPISQISSIQFKKAWLLTYGYLQCVLLGEESRRRFLTMLTRPPWSDPNAVTFNIKQQKWFEELKAAIERRMNK